MKSHLRPLSNKILEVFAILLTIITHWVVFYFIIVNACKGKAQAAKLSLALPTEWHFFENMKYIWNYNNHVFLRAFKNSATITIGSVFILIFVASMTAFVLERRGGKLTAASDKIVLAGLMTPLSVVPTFWVLKTIGLSGTLPGLILVEVAVHFSVSVMLYKGFLSSIPREIDEAAIVDGCDSWKLYFNIILPLTKPITATIIILRSTIIYNDFSNPMYFLSGSKSATVQLCIYTFQSAFTTDWAHLFAAILFVSIPPLLLFICLNRKIMESVTMGAVKG